MPRHERTQWVRLDLDGQTLLSNLAAGRSLARPIQFAGPALHCFGAHAAERTPLRGGEFTGRVTDGASCNADVITLTPHGNGTHTESVGHLTLETCDVQTLVPLRLLPAILVSVHPVAAALCGESSTPAPQPDDLLITHAAIEAAWPADLRAPLGARATIIRTLPSTPYRFVDAPARAPFLTREAVEGLVERGIEHLVLDVPSADRAEDGGALTAHRLFFGLPAGSHALEDARRAQCTITELAYVEAALKDGWYLLALHVPAIAGDAVPSRPVLYPLKSA